MVWTIPTLVAPGFFAAAIGKEKQEEKKVDEDDGDGPGEIEEGAWTDCPCPALVGLL